MIRASESWSEGLKLAPLQSDKLEISEYFGSRAKYQSEKIARDPHYYSSTGCTTLIFS